MGDSSSFEILSRGGGSEEPRQLAEDSFREDDSLESGLESMRIKLAVMKVGEELNRDEPPSSIDLAPVNKKLSDNDADENEDFKLEAIQVSWICPLRRLSAQDVWPIFYFIGN